MTFVLDASVAIKWFVSEAGSDEATELLAADMFLIAPDLLPIELANGLWRKVRTNEMQHDGMLPALEVLSARLRQVGTSAPLLPHAVELAGLLRHSVYDCIYLAMAMREAVSLVTADTKFLVKVRDAGIDNVIDLQTAVQGI